MTAARIREGSWIDIRDCTREQAATAFALHRQKIVKACHQLRIDVDSYNENFNPGPAIKIIFDFTEDVEEAEIGRKLKRGL